MFRCKFSRRPLSPLAASQEMQPGCNKLLSQSTFLWLVFFFFPDRGRAAVFLRERACSHAAVWADCVNKSAARRRAWMSCECAHNPRCLSGISFSVFSFNVQRRGAPFSFLLSCLLTSDGFADISINLCSRLYACWHVCIVQTTVFYSFCCFDYRLASQIALWDIERFFSANGQRPFWIITYSCSCSTRGSICNVIKTNKTQSAAFARWIESLNLTPRSRH